MEIGDLVIIYSYGNLSLIGIITEKDERGGIATYKVFWPDFKSWWYFGVSLMLLNKR